MAAADRPRLGVSACLMGKAVRYDGGHKRSRYLMDRLSEHFELVDFCPEVAIGLPVPRPPIHLHQPEGQGEVRAVQVADAQVDYTARLAGYADAVAGQVAGLAGFILKKDSPSCGMERVKVYSGGKRAPVRKGAGIFAARLMAAHPHLPVEEEGRLEDPRLRENFLVRVFTLHRWQALAQGGLTPAGLVDFHERHKFLILAHHQALYRELGRLVAQAGAAPLEALAAEYLAKLMQALGRRTTPAQCANVLTHIMGFLKERLSRDEKQELLALIDEHREGRTPLIVPITLLNHFLRRHPQAYIARQHFLAPHPRELMLRNQV